MWSREMDNRRHGPSCASWYFLPGLGDKQVDRVEDKEECVMGKGEKERLVIVQGASSAVVGGQEWCWAEHGV